MSGELIGARAAAAILGVASWVVEEVVQAGELREYFIQGRVRNDRLYVADDVRALATRGVSQFTIPKIQKPSRVAFAMKRVKRFLEERCDLGPTCEVPASEAWESFCRWCGDEQVSAEAFGAAIRRLVPGMYKVRRRTSGSKFYMYRGLRLIGEAAPAAAS